MTSSVPAEVFAPGEFIKEELDARGWTQNDLADILGRGPRTVSEVITGKRSITPATATLLSEAFGTSAELWMNLESAYQLAKVKGTGDTVSRKAALYDKVPLREMIRRNWIEDSGNVDVLEKRTADFLKIANIDDQPNVFLHAARKQSAYPKLLPSQVAWLFRAKELANAVHAEKFTETRFESGLKRLKEIMPHAANIRLVPNILAEAGIRFLIVEHLSKSKIDGVCFWLDKFSPVIVLSIRYDRIDWFWHTLLHELGHVNHKDGLINDVSLDVNLVGEGARELDQKPVNERRADKFATEFSVPKKDIENFIARIRPLYSHAKIQGFADRIGVHPGIVVGQLQHMQEIDWSHSRTMLVKVRNIVTNTALTDGWGSTLGLSAALG